MPDVNINFNIREEQNDAKKIEYDMKGIEKAASTLNTRTEKISKSMKTFGMSTEDMQKYLGPLYKGTNKQIGTLKNFAKSIDFGTDKNGRFTEGLGYLPRMMRNVGIAMGKNNKLIDISTGRTLSNAQAQRKMARGMKPFRMELLSVMFLGMQMQKTFGGLLQPAMKVTGVFKIWSTILTIMFLPVALLILRAMLWLLGIVNKLSHGTKMAIGIFVLLGLVMGMALFAVGQLGLAIDGLSITFAAFAKLKKMGGLVGAFKKGFSKIGKTLNGFKASMSSAGAAGSVSMMPIILAIVAIIAAIAILNAAWKNNWGHIRQHTGHFVLWFADVFDKYIKPVLTVIGAGIIALKDMIAFAITKAGLIWKVSWLSMVIASTKAGNAILSGIEFFVNNILTGPLRALWNSVRTVAGFLGKKLPPFPKLDLSKYKSSTKELERELNKSKTALSESLHDQLVSTGKSVAAWRKTMDNVAPTLKQLGNDTIETGDKIDKGLIKGTGFLDPALKSVGGTISDLTGNLTGNFMPSLNDTTNATDELTGVTDNFTGAIDKSKNMTSNLTKTMDSFTNTSLKETNVGLDMTATNFDKSSIKASELIDKIDAIPPYKSTIHEIIEKHSTGHARYSGVKVTKVMGTEGGKTYGEYTINGQGFSGIIPEMQMGGIVTKPLVTRIGEAGPEAVIPLKKTSLGSQQIINFNPNVDITINAASELDIDVVKDKLSKEWIEDIEEMIRR